MESKKQTRHLRIYLLLLLALQVSTGSGRCSGSSPSSTYTSNHIKRAEPAKALPAAIAAPVLMPVKVWAMPFGLESDPPSPKTKDFFYIVIKPSPSGIVQLPEPVLKNLVNLLQSKKLLNSTTGQNKKSPSPIFDESQVRMLIEFNEGDEIAWVDDKGTVQDKVVTFKLPTRDFHDLRKAVDEFYSKTLAEAIRTHVEPNKK